MKEEFSAEAYDRMLESLFGRFQSFQSAGSAAYKPGLDRMIFVDQLAGRPHRKYPCIHIAGTNGKGSVSNMIASALAATGLKVGLYTSPHILDFRERARVRDGSGIHYVPKEYVWDFVHRWEDTFDNIGLSFFEITTLLAFDWFAGERVDIAVIETGLGGRLDSTNIITPKLSVITNIGLDHCDILGSTLPEIAYEKAGIIKPGVPAVIGESDPATDPVFEKKFHYTNIDLVEKPELVFADRQALPEDFETILENMDLRGSYQRRNLATALAALSVLGVPASREALENTAARMEFHGRWERLSRSPEVLCDIGHNAHGLRYNFAQLSAAAEAGRGLIIVYGSVADKDVDAVLRLLPSCAKIVFTNADNHRALPAEEALGRYEAVGGTAPTYCEPSVPKAVRLALDLAREVASPLIYIGGSTYVVAEAVTLFK